MDLFSRRTVGWNVRNRKDLPLIYHALPVAVLIRDEYIPKGVIHHSDRGSTYASYNYAGMLSSLGITQSMSAKSNCCDNAAQESFYGKYKTWLVADGIFASEDEASSNAFEYIEVFYNRFRKHASLGDKSPL